MDNFNNNLPATFSVVYANTINNNLCPLMNDLFDKYLKILGINCDSFSSNTTSYGLNIILTNYIEDIRTIKSIFDTEGNSKEFIFNNNQLRNLGFTNNYLIKPAYDILLNTLQSDISDIISNFHGIYIIVFICFFVFIIMTYFIVWRPFIYKLNMAVYIIYIDL
jgi:hypothetical protein